MNSYTHALLTATVTTALLGTTIGPAYGYGTYYGGHSDEFDVEAHLVLGYGYDRGPGYTDGFGFGVRFGVPLAPAGILAGVEDSLALSVGVDLTYWSGNYQSNSFWGTSELMFPVMLQWNFYLTRAFSIFPEAGAAFGLGGCSTCSFFAAPGFALGARIHLDNHGGYPAFVFRIGFPVGITLGVLL